MLCFNTPIVPIIIDNPKVSGFHCILYNNPEEDNYLLIDGWGEYKSRNGVWVNSEKTELRTLQNKDFILLGCSEVTLKYEMHGIQKDAEIDKETLF